MKTRKQIEMELVVDGHHGVYIPQFLAQSIERELVKEVSQEDWDILEAGPDHEFYWETWESVLNNARIRPRFGSRYNRVLHQSDGDLWIGTPAQINKAFGQE